MNDQQVLAAIVEELKSLAQWACSQGLSDLDQQLSKTINLNEGKLK